MNAKLKIKPKSIANQKKIIESKIRQSVDTGILWSEGFLGKDSF